MAKRNAPALSQLVLKALYFEAKRRGIPMTRLADTCLTEVLQRTPGWQQAQIEMTPQQQHERPVSKDR